VIYSPYISSGAERTAGAPCHKDCDWTRHRSSDPCLGFDHISPETSPCLSIRTGGVRPFVTGGASSCNFCCHTYCPASQLRRVRGYCLFAQRWLHTRARTLGGKNRSDQSLDASCHADETNQAKPSVFIWSGNGSPGDRIHLHDRLVPSRPTNKNWYLLSHGTRGA